MSDIPYGYCHCGCGEKTNICTHTNTKRGATKGEPVRYISGHNQRGKAGYWRGKTGKDAPFFGHYPKPKPPKEITYKYGDTVPSGICQCGCGLKTTIARSSNPGRGQIKGLPYRYCRGHNNSHMPPTSYRRGDTKECKGCGRNLDVSRFTRHSATRDGLFARCKDCISQQSKVWRENNRDIVSAQTQNRRAYMQSKGGQVSAQQWRSILKLFDGKCAKCGASDNIHMDHVVPLAKGGSHSVDNVQPLCATCNLRKHTKIEDYRGKFYRPLALSLDNDTTSDTLRQ